MYTILIRTLNCESIVSVKRPFTGVVIVISSIKADKWLCIGFTEVKGQISNDIDKPSSSSIDIAFEAK